MWKLIELHTHRLFAESDTLAGLLAQWPHPRVWCTLWRGDRVATQREARIAVALSQRADARKEVNYSGLKAGAFEEPEP